MFIISIIYRIISVSDFGLAEYSVLIMTTMQVGYIVLKKSKTQTQQRKTFLKMSWLKIISFKKIG